MKNCQNLLVFALHVYLYFHHGCMKYWNVPNILHSFYEEMYVLSHGKNAMQHFIELN